jgi:hypothetical protein
MIPRCILSQEFHVGLPPVGQKLDIFWVLMQCEITSDSRAGYERDDSDDPPDKASDRDEEEAQQAVEFAWS